MPGYNPASKNVTSPAASRIAGKLSSREGSQARQPAPHRFNRVEGLFNALGRITGPRQEITPNRLYYCPWAPSYKPLAAYTAKRTTNGVTGTTQPAKQDITPAAAVMRSRDNQTGSTKHTTQAGPASMNEARQAPGRYISACLNDYLRITGKTA